MMTLMKINHTSHKPACRNERPKNQSPQQQTRTAEAADCCTLPTQPDHPPFYTAQHLPLQVSITLQFSDTFKHYAIQISYNELKS